MIIQLDESANDGQVVKDILFAIEDRFQYWNFCRLFGEKNTKLEEWTKDRRNERLAWEEELRG